MRPSGESLRNNAALLWDKAGRSSLTLTILHKILTFVYCSLFSTVNCRIQCFVESVDETEIICETKLWWLVAYFKVTAERKNTKHLIQVPCWDSNWVPSTKSKKKLARCHCVATTVVSVEQHGKARPWEARWLCTYNRRHNKRKWKKSVTAHFLVMCQHLDCSKGHVSFETRPPDLLQTKRELWPVRDDA